ncbi:MAG TPA: acyl transferase, partial [Cytophagales bacterium]|nr:acyl transferase [Cytophagales bacterium]
MAKLQSNMGFVHEFKSDLFNTSTSHFLQKSLDAFRFQYEHNVLYRQYVNALKVNAQKVRSLEQIPFLPISFFKHHQIVSTIEIYENFFESSGTTGSQRSRLYHYDSDFYLQNATTIFESFFGALHEYSFFFLLPSYLERQHSSLVAMVNYFFQKSDQRFGGFYLHDF